MACTDICLAEGRQAAFAVRGNPFRLLTARVRQGLMHLVEYEGYEGSIGQIARDGLEKKLIQCTIPPPAEHFQVHMLGEGTSARLSLPHAQGGACLLIQVVDDTFFLSGDATLVGTISGNMLHERIEPEIEHISG